jgi:hypothetical protein
MRSTLYAPSLWLDGWGVPWYSSFFSVITQKWLADYFPFAERDPWGIKDPRIRALVEQAISSGDSSQAALLRFQAASCWSCAGSSGTCSARSGASDSQLSSCIHATMIAPVSAILIICRAIWEV